MSDRKSESDKNTEDTGDDLKKTKNVLDALASGTALGLGIATGQPEIIATSALGFFSSVVSPIIKNRREKYVNMLYQSIIELQQKMKEFEPSNLSKNERFASAVVYTVEIAMKNDYGEKLEYLRNATLNTVIPIDIDKDLQIIFIKKIEDLTPTHIKILQFFETNRDEIREFARNNSERRIGDVIPSFVEKEFKNLEGKSERYLIDLSNMGLLKARPDGGGNASTIPEKNTNFVITEEGESFLRFIQLGSP